MLKKIIIVMLVILALLGIWWFFFKEKNLQEMPKEKPVAVIQHTGAFNTSIKTVVSSYMNMKSAFVEADTALIKMSTKKFLQANDSIQLDELKKDSAAIFNAANQLISDIKGNAQAILDETDVTEMRNDFKMVSENLYPLLKTIGYKGETLYWQNCPMAFGENKDASWLSTTNEILNPYLGKKHPEYKATMLHCGETIDSLR
ncbi:DUF3347 domain-containing protein [soil metagenome]